MLWRRETPSSRWPSLPSSSLVLALFISSLLFTITLASNQGFLVVLQDTVDVKNYIAGINATIASPPGTAPEFANRITHVFTTMPAFACALDSAAANQLRRDVFVKFFNADEVWTFAPLTGKSQSTPLTGRSTATLGGAGSLQVV